MKNLLLVVFIMFAFHAHSQKIFVLQPAIVDSKDVAKFEENEVKYAQILAQDAVEDGKLLQWVLLKKVRSVGRTGGELSRGEKVNYMWVHVYESLEQMVNVDAWWQTEKKFGIPSQTVYGNFDRVNIGNFVYKLEKQILTKNSGKYFLFNWTFPNDLNKLMDVAKIETEKWSQDKLEKYGMTSWSMATRVYPQGKEYAPLFFVDVYQNLDQVMKHLMGEAILSEISPEGLKSMSTIMPQGWHERVLFEIVAGAK
jgi:hypothetical protein|uniref:hypothetical protein n=1 Tax=Algoriphagus sp. TaxID=1872435 RepID=UPI004047DAAA